MASIADEAGRPYRLLCYMYFFWVGVSVSRVGYCQAAPSQPVPETEMLALDACKLVGKGLLICAVDARGSLDTDARLQTPIATEPLLAHFFKQLRDNCHVKDCIKQFRIHLPRRAAAAYQFVPTEV